MPDHVFGVHWRTGTFGGEGLPRRQDAVTWLCPDERTRYAALRVEKRRDDWLLGRVTLKALAQALMAGRWGVVVPPTSMHVDRRETGAPIVRLVGIGESDETAAGRTLPLAVSSSHSAGRALAAAAWIDRPSTERSSFAFGADLERVETRPASFVEDFLTAPERHRWQLEPATARDAVATMIWSAKEAVLKALQLGLRADTRWLTCLPVGTVDAGADWPDRGVLTGDGGGWRRFSVATDPRLGADGLSFAGHFHASDGYVFTIAVGTAATLGRAATPMTTPSGRGNSRVSSERT